jgi:hypothetical protein
MPLRRPRFTKICYEKYCNVTGGKPIAFLLQSISSVSAINPLTAFYDIHGRKGEVLLFYYFLIFFVGRRGLVVGMLAYYASGRGFDSRTV